MIRHSATKVDSFSFYNVRDSGREAERQEVTKMDGDIDLVVDASLENCI